MIIALDKASERNINAGLSTVLMPLSSIFVSVISFFLFKEKLQVTHVIGMLVVIAGATLIALFPAGSDSEGDDITT